MGVKLPRANSIERYEIKKDFILGSNDDNPRNDIINTTIINISENHDCHLLNENLAIKRTYWGWLGGLIRTDKVKWRYEVYRKEENLGPVVSLLYTIRNGWYGIVKWRMYVKRDNR